MEAFCIVVQFDRNGLSIAPYAGFSYLEKEEAGIEILPVRQDNVCRIPPACRSPAAVKIKEAGAAAMVPILEQELPAEHVTLWSENGRSPLKAVWGENSSKLTLDAGSFSIFESGEFAGEGPLDPIHPGEKRLLSYAADQAMRVKVTGRDGKRTLEHAKIAKGVVVETNMDVASEMYAASSAADLDRVVLIEHARRGNGLG
jgi:hypothetical protein